MLYKFQGRSAVGSWSAHKGFMCGMHFLGDNKLLTGGYDGKLICWDLGSMEQVWTNELGCLIRAISFDSVNGRIVLGLRNGTIQTMAPEEGAEAVCVMKGHSDGEVWGLDLASDGTAWTSCDDNKCIQWDVANHKWLDCFQVTDRVEKARKGRASTLSKLPASQCSRACCVNDAWVAIAGNDGCVSIRSREDPHTEVQLLSDSKEWIEVMRFNPDGTQLAVGSHDNGVYIYNVEDWSLKGRCRGHSSFIVALDWSADSEVIRSTDGAHEVLWFRTENCKQDRGGASAYKDTLYATNTCKFTWCNEGIFPKYTDGTHINGVEESPDTMHLATADDFGLVNIYRNPARQGAQSVSLRGHSEHVVRVKFSPDGEKLYSIGGYDQTLMIWRKC